MTSHGNQWQPLFVEHDFFAYYITGYFHIKFQVSGIHQFGDIARGSGRVPDPCPEILKKGTVKIIGVIIMVYPNS